ncbi:MAG: hypothetical protein NTV15_08030 [Candidatus Bathyarchaeota archaeon]|nr:hypothetical protein [Candidatus Bathyarchaeota archaeon]
MTEDLFNRFKKKILADVNRTLDYSNYHIETPIERETRLLSEEIQIEQNKQERKFYADFEKEHELFMLNALKYIREIQKERENQKST